jgi:hypothetical protein
MFGVAPDGVAGDHGHNRPMPGTLAVLLNLTSFGLTLQEVVAISGAFGIVGFVLWYYLFSHAYVLPFMPSSG